MRYGTLMPPSGWFTGQSHEMTVKPAKGSSLLPVKGYLSYSNIQIRKVGRDKEYLKGAVKFISCPMCLVSW